MGSLSCRGITFIKFHFCSLVYKYVIKVHHGRIFSDVYPYLLRLQMHWQIPDSYPVYFQKSDLTILDFTLFFFSLLPHLFHGSQSVALLEEKFGIGSPEP